MKDNKRLEKKKEKKNIKTPLHRIVLDRFKWNCLSEPTPISNKPHR